MLSDKFLTFVIDFFSRKKIYLQRNSLNCSTEIYTDLNLSDLDVDLFITEFLKEFKVDDSHFDSKKYFGTGISLIDNNVGYLKKIIGNKKWLPLEKEKRKPFTLGLLDEAIKTKKLE
ncbi:MAG: DUF1493 family protein [Flavobacteriales bacterium]